MILLNAVALHAMLISAIANVLCEHEAQLAVPDFTEKALRRQAEEACLRSKYGDNHWKLVCTATMTHGALQLLFCALAPWVVPLRRWAALDVAWWLFSFGTVTLTPTRTRTLALTLTLTLTLTRTLTLARHNSVKSRLALMQACPTST